MLMTLITLFVLFVATWIAMFLAKQISVPITALLDAASEVRKGNFKHAWMCGRWMSWPRWCAASTR